MTHGDRAGSAAVCFSAPGHRTRNLALITYLTRIQFDFGALNLLAEELKLLGMKRPLIATDKGVVAAGVIDQVKAKLGVAAAAVY